jgi:hypothetical protein
MTLLARVNETTQHTGYRAFVSPADAVNEFVHRYELE